MSAAATARLGGWPSRPAVGASTPDADQRSDPSPRGTPVPGEWIAGRYRVERVLARGGMGLVVQAEHAVLGKRVALKLLRQEVASDEGALQRFLDEARIAAQLPGDHIARALDFGRTETGDAYLVMELLVGRDLEAELRARGSLPVAEAVDYVLQACEGVAEAHAVGLVHRDLKPANLFLTRRRDGSALVKVLDFGISKRTLGAGPVTLTTRSAACGTPAYMAPEQMLPLSPVDARCDQHALAVVLFELIAGRRVFSADNLCALSEQILEKPAPRLQDVVADAPAGLSAALERALAKKPADRFPDVAGFASAIAPFGGPGAAAAARNVARVLEEPPLSRRSASSLLDAPPAAPVQARALHADAPDRVSEPVATLRVPHRGRRLGRVALGALIATAALLAVLGGIGALLDEAGLPPIPAASGIARAAHRARAALPPPPSPAPPPSAPSLPAAGGAAVPPRAASTADAGAARPLPRPAADTPRAAPRPAGVARQPTAGPARAAPRSAATKPRQAPRTPPAPPQASAPRKSAREVFGDR